MFLFYQTHKLFAREYLPSANPSVMGENTLGSEGGLLKLLGQRAALPGKELSFLLCPLTPPSRAGLTGHLPVKMGQVYIQINF
jgi:hypothetical protein